MEIDEISQEKIYSALRSLYRFNEMVTKSVPQILIDTESELLQKRFADLNPFEIYTLVMSWPEYFTEQSTNEILDNEMFQQHLLSLN